ncbi:hypothetical protein ACP3TJ_04980 [Desulforudis sp. 1088]|uniref:hypothetical protein n=1 Tax=Desulforudis sp. 1088 TaxID=3416137 RepID=UPI003CF81703
MQPVIVTVLVEVLQKFAYLPRVFRDKSDRCRRLANGLIVCHVDDIGLMVTEQSGKVGQGARSGLQRHPYFKDIPGVEHTDLRGGRMRLAVEHALLVQVPAGLL